MATLVLVLTNWLVQLFEQIGRMQAWGMKHNEWRRPDMFMNLLDVVDAECVFAPIWITSNKNLFMLLFM